MQSPVLQLIWKKRENSMPQKLPEDKVIYYTIIIIEENAIIDVVIQLFKD